MQFLFITKINFLHREKCVSKFTTQSKVTAIDIYLINFLIYSSFLIPHSFYAKVFLSYNHCLGSESGKLKME